MARKRILHLIHDDKFFDFTIEMFELFSDKIDNTYLCLAYSPYQKELKYIKNVSKINFVYYASKEYDEFLKFEYDAAIIHFFLDHYYNKTRLFSNKTKVFYFAWGGDFYSQIKYSLYQEKTERFFSEQILKYSSASELNFKKRFPTKSYLSISFFRFVYTYLRRFVYKYPEEKRLSFKKALKRIDFCATVVPEEFEILRKAAKLKAKQVFFNYPFPESALCIKSPIKENVIILNNSASIANNYIEVIDKLSSFEIEDYRIISSLSYGNDFSIKIEAYAKKKLGDNFSIIKDFLPFLEYEELLSKAKIGVFNSNIQMALGNINIMLYYGAKVFISEKSPVFEFFTKRGGYIYSTQNDLTDFELKKELSQEEKLKNREIILHEFGYESIKSKLSYILETYV